MCSPLASSTAGPVPWPLPFLPSGWVSGAPWRLSASPFGVGIGGPHCWGAPLGLLFTVVVREGCGPGTPLPAVTNPIHPSGRWSGSPCTPFCGHVRRFSCGLLRCSSKRSRARPGCCAQLETGGGGGGSNGLRSPPPPLRTQNCKPSLSCPGGCITRGRGGKPSGPPLSRPTKPCRQVATDACQAGSGALASRHAHALPRGRSCGWKHLDHLPPPQVPCAQGARGADTPSGTLWSSVMPKAAAKFGRAVGRGDAVVPCRPLFMGTCLAQLGRRILHPQQKGLLLASPV